jgi:hypothetical protein
VIDCRKGGSSKAQTMANQYSGMTVNERLYVSGLMEEFDKAVQERDVDRICRILSSVELADENIGPVLDQLGIPDRSRAAVT